MKPFYCSKVSGKKGKFNGNELVVKKASRASINRVDKLCDEENEYKRKKVYLPYFFSIIQIVALCIAGIGTLSLYMGTEYNIVSLEDFEWRVVILVTILSGIVLVGIFGYEKMRQINYEKSDICAEYNSRIENMFESIYLEMGVPIDAPYVDFLHFNYRLNGAGVVPVKTEKYSQLFNIWDFKFYSDNKKLYMASDEEVYAIDIANIKNITKVNEKIYLSVTKKQKNTIAKFKKNNVKGRFGSYKIESYYIMQFEHKEDLWGLYFPWYELPVIEELTGIKAKWEMVGDNPTIFALILK